MAQNMPQPPQTCSICQTTFASRNRLFDHLRSNHSEEWRKAQRDAGRSPATKRFRSKVAMCVGYDAHLGRLKSPSGRGGEGEGANTIIAKLIQASFIEALPCNLSGDSVVHGSVQIDCMSLASEAKVRPPIMAQDEDCSAASDVLVLDYSYETCGRRPLHLNIDAMRESINEHVKNWMGAAGDDAIVCVLAMTEPVPKAKLHAERSVTQRTYHYMLPMSWLDGGREAAEWYVRTGKVDVGQADVAKQEISRGKADGAAPPVISLLKKALKSVESPMRVEGGGNTVDGSEMFTRGRFGALGQRKAQSFHNYLPKTVRQTSRPMDGTFATIDRAKVVDLLPAESHDVIAVVEFRGDNFFEEQIRRHISEIVAMVNGYVPSDFHLLATSAVCEDEIPLAPSDRLYVVEPRYHFYDQAFGPLFQCKNERLVDEWTTSLQKRLIDRLRNASAVEAESDWLSHLEPGVPKITERQSDAIGFDVQQSFDESFPGHPLQSKSDAPIEQPREVPSDYQPVLSMLRDVVARKQWPPTSLARTRTMRSPHGSGKKASRGVGRGKKASAYSGQRYQCGSFVLRRNLCGMKDCTLFDHCDAIFELEDVLIKRHGLNRSPSTHCSVSHNVEYTPSRGSDKGNTTESLIVTIGNFAGGEVVIEGKRVDTHYKPRQYDGRNCVSWTAPFSGERFELCWFSLENSANGVNTNDSTGTRQEDHKATILAQCHNTFLPDYNPLRFRPNSTDALVVNEILDNRGCEYEVHRAGFDFSLDGHATVLDIGAHIGVFTRYALSRGAARVIAYEPEPSNAELFRHNSGLASGSRNSAAEFHICAVAHGSTGTAKLIGGRDRSDGVSNTWRHSLDFCSSKLVSSPGGVIHEVDVVPFFGGALHEGITFVKIDAEGAELDILLSSEARIESSWLDVTHLVFEYSFTKERRVGLFQRAIENLRNAGFRVFYEGMGAWWDTRFDVIWPYHNDHVVYAMRE